jgi:hypothetical protein
MKACGQSVFALGKHNQQIGTQRGPDLHAHAVGIRAEEAAQAQVLLDPGKEQFDGPAATIDLGHEQGVQVELIGEKYKGLAGIRIHITDTTKRIGVKRRPLAELSRIVWSQRNPQLAPTGRDATA